MFAYLFFKKIPSYTGLLGPYLLKEICPLQYLCIKRGGKACNISLVTSIFNFRFSSKVQTIVLLLRVLFWAHELDLKSTYFRFVLRGDKAYIVRFSFKAQTIVVHFSLSIKLKWPLVSTDIKAFINFEISGDRAKFNCIFHWTVKHFNFTYSLIMSCLLIHILKIIQPIRLFWPIPQIRSLEYLFDKVMFTIVAT